MTSVATLCEAIAGPALDAAGAAARRLDALTKPPGSLGRLEELAIRLAAITGGTPRVDAPVVFTFAADHGVVAEGVSAYPQIVTAQMVENFLGGGAAINVLARQAGARVVVADFGVATPLPARDGLVDCRIAAGTANVARGPAMTRAQAIGAIERGAALAEQAIEADADLLATGEMGIGNTTAAAAITAALTGAPPSAVTGRGTGLDDAGWRRKVDVVGRALSLNRPDPDDGLDVLAKVGGFEIGGLVGVILAGAARRVPVVLDGFIATAAALIAVRLAPQARHALFAAHRSAEPGHALALDHLGLAPYLDLSLRLGEGTGAALFIHLARAATLISREMATFEAAGVSEALPTTTPARGRGRRRRVPRLLAAIVAAALGATLIAATVPVGAATYVDMLGREVKLAAPPRRIVSLVPSATELIYALGGEDRLVGRTDFCDYPPAARDKPSVGGMIAPSLETIATLRPDLVIATTSGNRMDTFTRLGQLGIAVYAVHANRIAEMIEVARRLGELTGRGAAVAAFVATLERRLEAVARAVRPYPRPRVLYVLWPDPLLVPARGAILTELIALAGGDSITAAERGDYPRFSLEAAVARAPEVVLLASHGGPGSAPTGLEPWHRLASLPAIRNKRVHTIDGSLVHRYGPRVVEGVETLARAIHPEAFR